MQWMEAFGRLRWVYAGALVFACMGACGGDVRTEPVGGGSDGTGGAGPVCRDVVTPDGFTCCCGEPSCSKVPGCPHLTPVRPHDAGPPNFCGNGALDPGEECDGSRFGANTCSTVTFGARPKGRLMCANGCVLDATNCFPEPGAGGTSGGTGGGPNGGPDGGTGLGGSGSYGDPHVYTPDGLRYEFQAVGEFVLLEDERDPSFMIQVRQEPFHGSRSVSVNTAVALRVGSDRVSLHAGEPATLTVNGVVRTEDGLALSGGGRIDRTKDTYVVTFPAGDQFVVVAAWKAMLDVNYRPGHARRRKLRGLLGSADGAPENDLTARTGLVLAVPASPEALYEVFGESYRVTEAESLFDYAPGKTTDSYTDRAFPRRGGKDEKPSLERLLHGRDVCAAHGVKDESLQLGCALDVAFTGDEGFARAAAESERAVARSGKR